MKLTKDQKSVVIEAVKSVLGSGVKWETESLHFPVEAIVKVVLSIPGMKRRPNPDGRYGIEGFDTNGWQWDWWQEFSLAGKNYTLSGSGYYGGHSFHLSDDQPTP